ncbi:tetratricopeptide repeat protein [Rossellomorea marisflavi]|uniref:tetratricopeptide repeat protein n=1 Tax=Rossellomorea marisflavi TaxID=189381 RepID=UPI00296FE045|nr:tetratricopeptide repeat protein [Rossellomorea marisflavi]MDW4526010.1 tetratricopeptide repeat protein [Rossellomorea marisflavi]
MEDRMSEAIEARKSGNTVESIRILKELIAEHPKSGSLHYQCAWSHDASGLEEEAVEYYEKALTYGLDEEESIGAYTGLGSTYRALGKYEKSKEVLEDGLKKHRDRALSVFYSMTLYNLGETKKAMELLLGQLCDTSSDESIQSYAAAINYYSRDLDRTW